MFFPELQKINQHLSVFNWAVLIFFAQISHT